MARSAPRTSARLAAQRLPLPARLSPVRYFLQRAAASSPPEIRSSAAANNALHKAVAQAFALDKPTRAVRLPHATSAAEQARSRDARAAARAALQGGAKRKRAPAASPVRPAKKKKQAQDLEELTARFRAIFAAKQSEARETLIPSHGVFAGIDNAKIFFNKSSRTWGLAHVKLRLHEPTITLEDAFSQLRTSLLALVEGYRAARGAAWMAIRADATMARGSGNDYIERDLSFYSGATRSGKRPGVLVQSAAGAEAFLASAEAIIEDEIATKAMKQSGWSIVAVKSLRLFINRRYLPGGGSFLPLPPGFPHSRSVINPQTADKPNCFSMAVLICLHGVLVEDVKKNKGRPTQYEKWANELKMGNLPTPLPPEPRHFRSFEKLNPGVRVHVLACDISENSDFAISSVYVSEVPDADGARTCTLLYAHTTEGEAHYLAVAKPHALQLSTASSTGQRKKKTCSGCGAALTAAEHKRHDCVHDTRVVTKLLPATPQSLAFIGAHKRVQLPCFVTVHITAVQQRAAEGADATLVPCAAAAQLVSSAYPDLLPAETWSHVGTDAMEQLLRWLHATAARVDELYARKVGMDPAEQTAKRAEVDAAILMQPIQMGDAIVDFQNEAAHRRYYNRTEWDSMVLAAAGRLVRNPHTRAPIPYNAITWYRADPSLPAGSGRFGGRRRSGRVFSTLAPRAHFSR